VGKTNDKNDDKDGTVKETYLAHTLNPLYMSNNLRRLGIRSENHPGGRKVTGGNKAASDGCAQHYELELELDIKRLWL
jgi:hypothetical protein